MIGLLFEAAPLEQEQALVPGRLSVLQDRFRPRADIVPNFRPHLAGRTAQRPGVFWAERHAGVRVVIEKREIRTPAEPHRVPRIEHDADDRLEALGPRGGRPDRRLRPVEGPRPLAHFPAAREETKRILTKGSVRGLPHGCTILDSRHHLTFTWSLGDPIGRLRSAGKRSGSFLVLCGRRFD